MLSQIGGQASGSVRPYKAQCMPNAACMQSWGANSRVQLRRNQCVTPRAGHCKGGWTGAEQEQELCDPAGQPWWMQEQCLQTACSRSTCFCRQQAAMLA